MIIKLIVFLCVIFAPCVSVADEITSDTDTLYWTTTTPGKRHSGFTSPGLHTRGPNEIPYSTRVEGLIEIVQPVIDEFPNLPESGWLEESEIYNFNGTAVIVRQSHNRTEHDPSDVPALFSVHRADGDRLEWIANEYVASGKVRIYNNTEYTCLQSHTTQVDWTPDVTPALWQEIVEAGEEWAAGVAYTVDQEVVYNGTTYRCLQAHTSIVTWEPPNVPALWQVVQ